LEQPEFREELLPISSEKRKHREQPVPGLVAQAREEMTVQLEHEIARLKELQKVNRSVQPEEVELLIQQHKALDQHLSGARLRLDAIRLIQRGPG
jgi:ATP-dependent helicase HepA